MFRSIKHHRQHGFTLIEMLFILMVLSILTVLFIPQIVKTIEKQQSIHFFKLFDSDILFIQNQTMNSDDTYRITLTKDYYMIVKENREIEKREYPNHLTLSQRNVRIYFSKSGTVTSPQTIRFQDRYHTYRVVFPLGKGRHYIEVR